MALPFFARLALVLIGLCLPAAAGAAETCPGDHSMADQDRGKTTVIRTGTGNTATIVRHDPDGTIHLEQHGKDNATLVNGGPVGAAGALRPPALARSDPQASGEKR